MSVVCLYVHMTVWFVFVFVFISKTKCFGLGRSSEQPRFLFHRVAPLSQLPRSSSQFVSVFTDLHVKKIKQTASPLVGPILLKITKCMWICCIDFPTNYNTALHFSWQSGSDTNPWRLCLVVGIVVAVGLHVFLFEILLVFKKETQPTLPDIASHRNFFCPKQK